MGDEHAQPSRTCLVVAAHPDDIESWCAGSVAVLVRQGWQVAYLLCTSGEKGTSDPAEPPEVVAARREAEQREASRRVGAREPVFLRLPDGGLEDDAVLRGSLVRAIRRHRPDLLITHDPVHPWPPYTTHRDHRIAGRSRSTPPTPTPATRCTSRSNRVTKGCARTPCRRSGSSAPTRRTTTLTSPMDWRRRSRPGSPTPARPAIQRLSPSPGAAARKRPAGKAGCSWLKRSSA